MKKVSLGEWLIVNLKIGALSFGGSGRLALYQDACVDEKKWLTNEEFNEVLTLAQVLPGPSLVNLAMYLGIMLVNFWSGVAGLIALVVPGAIAIVALVSVVNINNPDVARVFQGFSIGSVIIFLLFLERVWGGLFFSVKTKELSKFKKIFRLSVVIAAAMSSLANLPLIPVILIGIAVCLIGEFT